MKATPADELHVGCDQPHHRVLSSTSSVPEPQHAIAVPFEGNRSRAVTFDCNVVVMLTAVELDNELRMVTCKVGYVPRKWDLPPEVTPLRFEKTQLLPQHAFRWRCGGSKFARQLMCHH